MPFVPGGLLDPTRQAVAASGLPAAWAPLPADDPAAYGRLFRSLWASHRSFIVCEQDVAPTGAQWAEIASCGHLWCSYSYDDGLYPDGPMFGLVRFDRQVMEQHPHAAEVALVIGKRRDQEAEWWRVDALMARDLGIRGVPWHLHTPPVAHHHHGPPSGPV